MAINFSNDKVISEVSGRVSSPGRIIQTVHTIITTGVATSSTSAVGILDSAAITLTNPNNRILIEIHSDNRSNDWGDGVWNLHYMDIIHNQSGAQISYTGYNGEQTNNIRHVHRVGIHTPGSVGPHSYKMRGWSYQASSTSFVTGSDGTVGYIRLTEIAV
jgi:hypothetical protein